MKRKELTALEHALWELYRSAVKDKKNGDASLLTLWNLYASGSEIVNRQLLLLDDQALDDIRRNGT